MNNKFNIEEVKIKAELEYPDLIINWDQYKDAETKISMICKHHGELYKTPKSILYGHGCRKCGFKNSGITQRTPKEEFLKLINIKHNNEYTYILPEMVGTSDKIKVFCSIHGEFNPSANNHKIGSKCPKCVYENRTSIGHSRTDFVNFCKSKNRIAKLYIIKCFTDTEEFIKIGITSRTVKQRFYKDKMNYEYEILKVKESTPERIWNLEKNLLNRYKKFKYIPTIDFAGKYECLKFN